MGPCPAEFPLCSAAALLSFLNIPTPYPPGYTVATDIGAISADWLARLLRSRRLDQHPWAAPEGVPSAETRENIFLNYL